MSKVCTRFQTKALQKPYPLGCTCPRGLYKGVPPPSPPGLFNNLLDGRDVCFLRKEKNSLKELHPIPRAWSVQSKTHTYWKVNACRQQIHNYTFAFILQLQWISLHLILQFHECIWFSYYLCNHYFIFILSWVYIV